MGAGKARLFNCSLAPLLGAVRRRGALAEGVGFEPTVRTRRTTVFKTVPLNRSGTPPRYKIARRATDHRKEDERDGTRESAGVRTAGASEAIGERLRLHRRGRGGGGHPQGGPRRLPAGT